MVRPPLPAAVFFCAVVRARDPLLRVVPLLRDVEVLPRDAGALREAGFAALRDAVLLLREAEPVARVLGLLLRFAAVLRVVRLRVVPLPRDDADLLLAEEDAEPVRLRLEAPRDAVLFAVRAFAFEVPVFLVVLRLSAM